MATSQSTKPETTSLKPQEGSATPSGYPILERMKRLRMPLNRETYLTLDRWEPNPTVTPEEEMSLPPQFRLPEVIAKGRAVDK